MYLPTSSEKIVQYRLCFKQGLHLPQGPSAWKHLRINSMRFADVTRMGANGELSCRPWVCPDGTVYNLVVVSWWTMPAATIPDSHSYAYLYTNMPFEMLQQCQKYATLSEVWLSIKELPTTVAQTKLHTRPDYMVSLKQYIEWEVNLVQHVSLSGCHNISLIKCIPGYYTLLNMKLYKKRKLKSFCKHVLNLIWLSQYNKYIHTSIWLSQYKKYIHTAI